MGLFDFFKKITGAANSPIGDNRDGEYFNIPLNFIHEAVNACSTQLPMLRRTPRKSSVISTYDNWHSKEIRFLDNPELDGSWCQEEDFAQDVTFTVFRFEAIVTSDNDKDILYIRFGEGSRKTIIEVALPEISICEIMPANKMFNIAEIEHLQRALSFTIQMTKEEDALFEDLENYKRMLMSGSDDKRYDPIRTDEKWIASKEKSKRDSARRRRK
tara:strand:+ start:1177 stop:1821 length:645 start_codon:yes stop_codon:yes gene_type:complete